jgi:L-glutamine-phosphate cytidylyltransferase
MRAIVLAAGMGTRLGKYTQGLPKGMLAIEGKTILQHQLETYHDCGIHDIVVVKGYAAEKIDYDGVNYCVNVDYASTNMVESLMCARGYLDTDVIISYADVVFEERVLRGLMDFTADMVVTVDTDWQQYWTARFGDLNSDLEGLQLDATGKILRLGDPDVSAVEIDARYVGILKFSRNGAQRLIELYESARENYAGGKWRYSKNFRNAYMTDLIQELIDEGEQVSAYPIKGGWLEFDTVEDYENYQRWIESGTMSRFTNLWD